MFFIKKYFLLNLGCIRFEVSYSVYQFNDGGNISRKAILLATHCHGHAE